MAFRGLSGIGRRLPEDLRAEGERRYTRGGAETNRRTHQGGSDDRCGGGRQSEDRRAARAVYAGRKALNGCSAKLEDARRSAITRGICCKVEILRRSLSDRLRMTAPF